MRLELWHPIVLFFVIVLQLALSKLNRATNAAAGRTVEMEQQELVPQEASQPQARPGDDVGETAGQEDSLSTEQKAVSVANASAPISPIAADSDVDDEIERWSEILFSVIKRNCPPLNDPV